jgi:hypothetical protein
VGSSHQLALHQAFFVLVEVLRLLRKVSDFSHLFTCNSMI